MGINELDPIALEFERQAESFRHQLPPTISFPDVPEAATTEWKQYTRGRYYRILELMHRPFLFALLHPLQLPIPLWSTWRTNASTMLSDTYSIATRVTDIMDCGFSCETC